MNSAPGEVPILLWIVTGMTKDAEVEASLHPITAGNDNSMFPSLDELIVEDDLPLSMYEFAVAKSHEHVVWSISTRHLLCCKVFE